MHAVNAAIAAGQIKLPPGYNIFWSGQYEYMLRARPRLLVVVPLTLLDHPVHHLFQHAVARQNRHRAAGGSVLARRRVLGALPGSTTTSASAVWVGIIALAGLDAETGVVMLLYLDLGAIYKSSGEQLAKNNVRSGYHGSIPTRMGVEGSQFGIDFLEIWDLIRDVYGEQIGWVYTHSDLQQLHEHLVNCLLVVLAVWPCAGRGIFPRRPPAESDFSTHSEPDRRGAIGDHRQGLRPAGRHDPGRIG